MLGRKKFSWVGIHYSVGRCLVGRCSVGRLLPGWPRPDWRSRWSPGTGTARSDQSQGSPDTAANGNSVVKFADLNAGHFYVAAANRNSVVKILEISTLYIQYQYSIF